MKLIVQIFKIIGYLFLLISAIIIPIQLFISENKFNKLLKQYARYGEKALKNTKTTKK